MKDQVSAMYELKVPSFQMKNNPTQESIYAQKPNDVYDVEMEGGPEIFVTSVE